MITLLASIAGFIGSIIPDILKFFSDVNDKKHELEIFKYQIKLAEKNIKDRLQEIDNISDISESRSLYSTYTSNISWVDALNGTVRPVLAYSFFTIYAVTKYLQFQLFLKIPTTIANIEIIWGAEDQAIFAGIISFYYGQRALLKIRGKV